MQTDTASRCMIWHEQWRRGFLIPSTHTVKQAWRWKESRKADYCSTTFFCYWYIHWGFIFSRHSTSCLFAMWCWNRWPVLKLKPYLRFRSKENIPMDAWQIQLGHTRRPFDRSALYFCGFPTLQHIKHKVCVPQCPSVPASAARPRSRGPKLRSKEPKAPALTVMRSALRPNIIKALDANGGAFFFFPHHLTPSFIRRRLAWWCSSRAAEGRTPSWTSCQVARERRWARTT